MDNNDILMKYSEDFIDLFLKFKDINNNYCGRLFEKNNSYDLVDFLMKNIQFYEIIEEDDINNESDYELY